MTNREWLNNLNNEDFIRYLASMCNACANKGKNCTLHGDMNCFEGCIKWLEQEHEG